jgi:hypothetical protein
MSEVNDSVLNVKSVILIFVSGAVQGSMDSNLATPLVLF